MAKLTTGNGKFGVKVRYDDGDIEFAYRTSKSDRDKLYNTMKDQPGIKSIDKVNR